MSHGVHAVSPLHDIPVRFMRKDPQKSKTGSTSKVKTNCESDTTEINDATTTLSDQAS